MNINIITERAKRGIIVSTNTDNNIQSHAQFNKLTGLQSKLKIQITTETVGLQNCNLISDTLNMLQV